MVADAWRRVLGGDSFGRHTNFFEAGGDSLLAARLQLELGARLGREIRLVDVFARPTVAGFVAGLGEERAPRRRLRRGRLARRAASGRPAVPPPVTRLPE